MTNKTKLDDAVAVDIPLNPYDSTEPKIDDEPPQYQNPQMDFSSGWKDVGFAIAFWIHVVIVICLGTFLGLPVVIKVFRDAITETTEPIRTDFDFKPFVYSLGGAAGIGGLVSFGILFVLQMCIGHFIKCTFAVLIMLQILMVVVLYFIFAPLCMIPVLFIMLTLLYITCVRKRLSFAEAHLQAGTASLRSHPSLILVAIAMLIVELLWFIFWSLMLLGVGRALNFTVPITKNITTNETQVYVASTMPTSIKSSTFFINRKEGFISSTPYLMKTKLTQDNSAYFKNRYEKSNTTNSISSSNEEQTTNKYFQNAVVFLLMLSWYWGAITFGNIIHFITACSVGDWWFTGEGSRHYSMGNSIKRAFTTSMGSIAFGSLFEAIVKALRSFTSKKRDKNILACIADCILSIIEKIIGYFNEWAFIFVALTGQGFVQAGRNVINLFKKRGWTTIINDTIISSTLGFINLVVGLISCMTGGCLMHFLMKNSDEKIIFIVIICIPSFLIGIFISSIITSLLMSCARTVFVCFALNPAALGATHPDHLQRLTKAWHKFYPQEFTTSGYANQYKEPTV